MKEIVTHFGLSQRRLSRLTGWNRSTLQYACRERSDTALRERMRYWAALKPRWGAPILHDVLRAEGLVRNHKRTERIYREEGLSLRRKRRRKLPAVARVPLPQAAGPDERWSMDFVRDTTSDGRPFRVWALVDDLTRECPLLLVDRSLPARRVVEALEALLLVRQPPATIVCDNGPEFVSLALDQWATSRGVRLDFITPGRPVENCFIESFNGTFRDDYLNMHWFLSLSDAKRTIEDWRRDYNEVRPHSSLGGLTPSEFVEHHQQRENHLAIADSSLPD